jgi:CBS domain-containing protein
MLTAVSGNPSAATRPDGSFLFFSELVGLPILGQKGEKLGRLVDVLIDGSDPAYPLARAIAVRRRRNDQVRRIAWSDVVELGQRQIRVRGAEELLRPPERMPNEISVAEDVIDRQLVDTNGAKVRRANDLHFLFVRGELRLAHVDVGFRALIRRVGFQAWVDGAMRTILPKARYLTEENFVRWKNVQSVNISAPRLRLDVTRSALAKIHPADLAEILAELNQPQRAVLFGQLPKDAAAWTLEEADAELQRDLLSSLRADKAADLVEAMEPDEAADLLGELPAHESAKLLAAMHRPQASELKQLLKYPPNAAGGMMTPGFLKISGNPTIEQALREIRSQASSVKYIHDVFVTDAEGKLTGYATLRELLLAEPSQPISSLVKQHPAPLDPQDSAQRAAELAAKYKLLSLPVRTEDAKLVGVVTVDDLLEHIIEG